MNSKPDEMTPPGPPVDIACGKGNPPETPPEYLTGIRDPYTLADTPEHESEADRLAIRNFLNTLAEVALAVASRTLKKEER